MSETPVTCGEAAVVSGVQLLELAVDRLLTEAPVDLPPQVALDRARSLLACSERLVAVRLAAVADRVTGDGTVSAPGPATVAGEPGQQVALYHCGVQPLMYESRAWEVEDPPFDATNAPDTFSGFGTFSRTGDVLTFLDRDGARLTFTPDDGTPDPYLCA